MFRYLLKSHSFRRTPVLLKHTLGARKLVSAGGRFQPQLDWLRDFFMAYPPVYAGIMSNLPPNYRHLSNFWSSNKSEQRELLQSCGIMTPESHTDNATHYIVRPNRHYGGVDYRIVTDPTDFNPATHYVAPAFPKKREYRVVFVYGHPLILMRKKPGPNVGPFDPWNHANGSYFQTISSMDQCRLAQDTSFFSDIQKICVVRDAHLVAADVMSDGNRYAVTELNFSPSITLHDNLLRIKNHVESVQNH